MTYVLIKRTRSVPGMAVGSAFVSINVFGHLHDSARMRFRLDPVILGVDFLDVDELINEGYATWGPHRLIYGTDKAVAAYIELERQYKPLEDLEEWVRA